MKSTYISENIAEFRLTKNPLYLAKAARLTITQRRCLELGYGIYCKMLFPPYIVKATRPETTQTILSDCGCLLSVRDALSRDELMEAFGEHYALHCLPSDFAGARLESIVCNPKFLLIGEYGDNAKKLALLTRDSCVVNDYYELSAKVLHIHAVHRFHSSTDFLVTTGDTAKYLDLWSLQDGELVFRRRLRRLLAGQTAITVVADKYYLGSDFSSRPNYIERMEGKKFFFPRPAYLMCVAAFYQHSNRFIVALNADLPPFGGGIALSIFDTVAEEFIYCEHVGCVKVNTSNKALRRQAISLRSRAMAALG